jgi:hypothetical protein
MAGRAQQLQRLHRTWAQRQRMAEMTLAVALRQVAKVDEETRQLRASLDQATGLHLLLPHIFAQRLASLARRRQQAEAQCTTLRATLADVSLARLRVHKLMTAEMDTQRRHDEAKTLESVIETVLAVRR